MIKGIFPGSFDPFTLGHLDIARRSARVVDKLYVAVLINASKRSAFTMDERINMIRAALDGESNIEVISFDGLLVDCAKQYGASVIIRSLRDSSDYLSERQMETINKRLCPDLEIVYLNSAPELMHISSSAVRELASYGCSIEGFVPEINRKIIIERLCKNG